MHDHRHQSAGHGHPHRRGALLAALLITAAFALLEVIGGLVTGSLALLADAGHMTTDIGALAFSLFAAWLAGRPRTPRRSFGYLRMEILAALFNGVALVVIALVIGWQAVSRWGTVTAIEAGPMLVVALAGLGANVLVATILVRAGGESLNVRGALLHVLSDLLGSVGAVTAGVVILVTDWQAADTLASLLIAALILVGAARLVRDAVDILLEGAPARVDVARLEAALCAAPGVAGIHDLHVWTLTTGFIAMSGHAELDDTADPHQVLDTLTEIVMDRFDIRHVTIQAEPLGHLLTCHDGGCEVWSPEEAARVLGSR